MTTQRTEAVTSRHFRVEQVAGGVWAALSEPGAGAVGNAGIVDLGGRVLIFDTFRTPQAARDLRAAATALTDSGVLYVVNSHYHGDHVFGNQVFADATIISTERTGQLVAERGPSSIESARENEARHFEYWEGRVAQAADPAERERLALRVAADREFQAALPELDIELPHITFAPRLSLYGDRRGVEIITFGGGHTESDGVLWLPEDRLLFAGDLVSIANHPMLWDGDPDGWLRILDELEALGPEIVVPGHGPVGRYADIGSVRRYITDMRELAVNAGLSDEHLEVLAPPEPYDAWLAPELFPANLRFLRERAAGARR